jgi:hypothetical protein
MDSQRYRELDNSGSGLTEEEWNEGWHWCLEWDSMLVGPGTEEALFCSCNHPTIEKWKASPDGQRVRSEMDQRLDHLEADFLNEMFRRTDGE